MKREMPVQLSPHQQKQMQELQTKMSVEIQQLMKSNFLPKEFIHPQFAGWLELAREHETAKSMNCSYEDFKLFWKSFNEKHPDEFNMWEMGFAINCVSSKSQAQLQCNPEYYIKIQDAASEMIDHWNNHLNKIKAPITDRYKVLMDRVRQSKPIIMPNTEIVH